MRKNRKYLVLSALFCMLFIVSCTPSEQVIQTAIAQTELAKPTDAYLPPTETVIPSPTVTFTPTVTETPTPTPTSTPTVTPTPDLRIVDTDPQKLLCKDGDFPKEGYYYLPEGGMNITTNGEVLSGILGWGVEEGRGYLVNTGRVTSWLAVRLRNTKSVEMPQVVVCDVTMFLTTDGAKLALRKYNDAEVDYRYDWQYIQYPMNLGDENIVLVLYKPNSTGDMQTIYQIVFTYRNILTKITGYALKKDVVPHVFLEELARKMLERIHQEPLVNPEDAIIAVKK
jgi:hypothetical protein